MHIDEEVAIHRHIYIYTQYTVMGNVKGAYICTIYIPFIFSSVCFSHGAPLNLVMCYHLLRTDDFFFSPFLSLIAFPMLLYLLLIFMYTGHFIIQIVLRMLEEMHKSKKKE